MIGLLTNFLGSKNKASDTMTESGRRKSNGDTVAVVSNGDDEITPLNEEALLPVIVEKFQQGEVTEDQIKVLRKHLNFDKSDGVEVKLEHLTNRVSELEAYTDALEAFIDEEGTAEEIFTELRTDLGETNEQVRAIQSRIDTLEKDQSTIEDRISQLDESIESLDSFVRELDGRHSREIMGVDAKIDRAEIGFDESLTELESDLEALRNRVDDVETLEASVMNLESDVEELQELNARLESIKTDFEEDLHATKAELESVQDTVGNLDGVQEEVESLKELDARVVELERLADEIGEMQDSLSEMERFRTKLINTVSMDEVSSVGD